MATQSIQTDEVPIRRRAAVRTVIGDFILGAVLFVAAGDLHWLQGWIYMAILVASTVLPLSGPFRVDEGLIRERMSRKSDAKRWDWIFVALVGILTIAELVVPGLDHRWRWTDSLEPWVAFVGFVMVASGTAVLIMCMITNRFFSAVIRIQKDRGHAVISSGPYRVVRHPGYASWTVRTLGVPLLLESYWAFIPAGVFVASFIVRTVLEDRTLQAELSGYREYAAKVKYRLVPGIW